MTWFWPFGPGRYVRLRPEALPTAEVAAIREAILDSPYMSVNNLNERFNGTYGFSAVFGRDGIEEAQAEFPAFGPFLEKVIEPGCNAFFLNPLLLADGAAVKPHIDLSLSSYCPTASTPRVVSVLYVEVPEGLVGGTLRLYQGDRPVAEVTPRARMLATFRGDCRHEVTAVSAGAPGIYEARLSLVLEQYRVTDLERESLPRFRLGTRRAASTAERPLAGGAGEGSFGDAVREALGEEP